MGNNLRIPTDIDPSSLHSNGQGYYEDISALYHKYWDELRPLCEKMRAIRKNMLEQGFSADFSDRESEILYLVLRESKPDLVVEISPCHGYSTNYILAALTHNKKGQLHSFEIQERVHGIAITDVIKQNLDCHIDKSRLKLHIGDATKAVIPECDFLFIDSCHQAYFASWYFSKLVSKPKLVFIHNILFFDRTHRTLVPKAAFMGIREQYYILESF